MEPKLFMFDRVSAGTGMSPSVEIYNDTNGFKVNASLMPSEAEGHRYVALVGTRVLCQLMFQQGPVRDNGINGLTNEALLAILIHRTEILDTQFPCVENKLALESMKDALWAFNERTNKRIARGVEGTLAP
ncbi:MAG: hypothetical protein ACD_84C00005G0001 [uncultured bacterium]|nr:MAG: hypothetical protein ACD_84C00005G0001 [uncultured bacterium]